MPNMLLHSGTKNYYPENIDDINIRIPMKPSLELV